MNIITGIDIDQDAAGRHFVRESKIDDEGEWIRHSMSYASMEDLHHALTEDAVQWLPWQLKHGRGE